MRVHTAPVEVHNEISGAVVGTVVQVNEATVLLPAAPPVAMAGLPAQSVFVGRERELGLLVAALRSADETAVVVWSLGGLGGIGKTALAVRAAQHALREGWFPGGVLMVNLRGYDPPADRVTASAALASLLGALGVAGQHIPLEPEDRARLWRSVLAERERTLILADNASSVDQVRLLLPGTAEHRVVITSRHRLADVEGARLLDLDVLPFSEAVAMLVDELATSDPDDGRVRDDPRSADMLVRLCGGLPLAVRVAAALLASDPARPVAELASDLAEDRRRLEELNYGGSLAVRAAFDLSYWHLEDSHARLFRLIALNPGPEIGVDALVALTGTGLAEVKRSVRELVCAHLLQPGSVSGRWRMHDLVGLYAAAEIAGDPERDAAVIRLLDHYRTVNREAYLTFVEPPSSQNEHGHFGDRLEALRWADTERGNMVAAVVLAFTEGHYRDVIRRSLEMFSYLNLRCHWNDMCATHEVALEAARRLGDRPGEGRLLTNLGTAHRQGGRFAESLGCLRLAESIYREIGDRLGEAEVLNALGTSYRDMKKPTKSIDFVQRALPVFLELGHRSLEGSALYNLAVAHRLLGMYEQAIGYHLRDLELSRDIGERMGVGRILDQLGLVYRETGRFAEAVHHHQQNLLIAQEVGDWNGEARTRVNLGVTYLEWGRFTEAIACVEDATLFFHDSGDRSGEADALSTLGSAMSRSGDVDGAKRSWRAALGIFETLPHAVDRATRVRRLLATIE